MVPTFGSYSSAQTFEEDWDALNSAQFPSGNCAEERESRLSKRKNVSVARDMAGVSQGEGDTEAGKKFKDNCSKLYY